MLRERAPGQGGRSRQGGAHDPVPAAPASLPGDSPPWPNTSLLGAPVLCPLLHVAALPCPGVATAPPAWPRGPPDTWVGPLPAERPASRPHGAEDPSPYQTGLRFTAQPPSRHLLAGTLVSTPTSGNNGVLCMSRGYPATQTRKLQSAVQSKRATHSGLSKAQQG